MIDEIYSPKLFEKNIQQEKNLKKAFSIISYQLIKYLEEKDLKNLKLTNKYFNDIVDCNELFKSSIKSLNGLFSKIADEEEENKNKTEKKSKFREKYTFNKSMNELYKHSADMPPGRIKSSMKK